MKYEYLVKGKNLLTVDAIRALYEALPQGGFLTEEGMKVETATGNKVHVDGNRRSLEDALDMLPEGRVNSASLSHHPVYSMWLVGGNPWYIGLSMVDDKTMHVFLKGTSHKKVLELKAIVDSYFLNRTSAPGGHGGPRTEPWPVPSAFPGDPDYKTG